MVYRSFLITQWVGLMVKKPSDNAGDTEDIGWIPGLGSPPGVENGKPLQYSCLENSMDRGTCPCGCKGSDMTEHTHTHTHTYKHIHT